MAPHRVKDKQEKDKQNVEPEACERQGAHSLDEVLADEGVVNVQTTYESTNINAQLSQNSIALLTYKPM